ncbi:transglycosylase domain-containing protein [Paenibacillus thalictri]|uniref:PBP1A family penicillin-binding protein n=1 Tax=Paenibacillus thalictri TaxID=2527873 RepID=A0A4Q9DTD6_9BACL|nr:PBP1A family penicillin-binding protein [Paenibacillus thalictri]TBL80193.1 PBP1A family penicillin-binding protein [Paenibacillus thalictri]
MAEKKKQTTAKKPKKKTKITAGKVVAGLVVAGALGVIGALGLYAVIIYNGNTILKQNIDKLDMDEASHLYDVNGNEMTVMYRENRELVTFSEIPDKLQQAFKATEDRRFDQHSGIDFVAVGRALVKDVVNRSAVEGGSTITQQLAKNVFLSSNKTFFRKATEMSIAVALEGNFTKDEILEKYLNRIFFANGAYGVKAAAKKYFGVSDLKKLELWQMATLAAIPKSPGNFNPIDSPEKSKERRGVVLKLMFDQGYITEDEKNKAAAVEYVPPKDTGKKDYLTVTDYVLKEATEQYGLSEDDLLRSGYKIYTTIDANAQKIMETTYANEKFFQKDGPEQKIQSSMAIVNNKDGGIVAMIGGRDYVKKGLNRAADPRGARQPGSSFKPIIDYGPALESGKYTPYSKLKDEETTYGGSYSPRNYDGVYQGEVDMFESVRRSINAPAVWLLNEIKISTAKAFASKLGITFDPQDNNLAIALGGMTKGVTPLQLAAAYAAFPNQGYYNKPHAVLKIVDGDGTEVASYKAKRDAPAMSAKTAWYMTQLLQGVVEPGGTGTAAKFDRPVAGKTGTTQLDLKGLEKFNRDVWFAGYTPEWSAAVWMGFEKTDTKHYVLTTSGSMPAAIFKEVMSKALAGRPKTQFVKPDGVADLTAPPKAIGDLKAELVIEQKPSVKLTWSGLGDKLSYKLYRKEEKEKDFQLVTTTTGTEIRDITVNPGSYQYYVTAFNPENNTDSDKSNVEKVDVPQNALDPLNPGNGVPGANGQPGGAGNTQPGDGKKPGNGAGNNGAQPGTIGPGSGAGAGQGNGNGGNGNGASGTGQPAPGGGPAGAGQTAPGGGAGGNGTAQPGGGSPKPGAGGNNGNGSGANGAGHGTGGAGNGANNGNGGGNTGTAQPGTGAGATNPPAAGSGTPASTPATTPGAGGATQPQTEKLPQAQQPAR